MQDISYARHLTAHDKGKEPIVPDDVDTLEDDELSSGSSPNLSPVKSCRNKSRQRHLYRPTFNNADNDTFYRARRETDREQNQQNEAPENTFALPTGIVPPIEPGYPAFDT